LKHEKSKKQNKIVKATLALLIAGTVFTTTTVLAEETVVPIDVELQIEGQDRAESNELAETENDQLQESPSLVPGDFFYFTKILLEKIQLALTFDDTKEARLIAEYAAKRLAEAEVLFAEGDEEAALETMTEAIDYMEKTDNVVEEPPADEPLEEKTDLIDIELEVIDDDISSAEATKAEDEIVAMVSQNIIALTAAMEKVKNPKAKAALQKNIDKTYAKLAKKLEKHQKAAEKIIKKESVIIDPMEVDDQAVVTEGINNEVKDSLLVLPSKQEKHEAAKIEKKKIQQEAKQQRNEVKAKEKEEKTEEKRQHKVMKKEEKSNKGNNGKGN
jgi:hypothetical protein